MDYLALDAFLDFVNISGDGTNEEIVRYLKESECPEIQGFVKWFVSGGISFNDILSVYTFEAENKQFVEHVHKRISTLHPIIIKNSFSVFICLLGKNAAFRGHYHIFVMFDSLFRDSMRDIQRTAIMRIAIHGGNVDIVRYLTEVINVTYSDDDMSYADYCEHYHIVRYLGKNGKSDWILHS